MPLGEVEALGCARTGLGDLQTMLKACQATPTRVLLCRRFARRHGPDEGADDGDDKQWPELTGSHYLNWDVPEW
jgi:hypothetical protein